MRPTRELKVKKNVKVKMGTMLMGALTVAMLAFAPALDAQGRGQPPERTERPAGADRSRGQGKGVVKETRRSGGRSDRAAEARLSDRTKPVQDARGRGDTRADDNRGRAVAGAASDQRIVISEIAGVVEPMTFESLVLSPRPGNQVVGRALAAAANRGVGNDALRIRPATDRVRVVNNSGALLVDWDDNRELGAWRVVTAPFSGRRGAPSFCRTGAGHPVWGRQWCVDKGFGLGADEDLRWGRVLDPSDVIIRPTSTGDLTRDVLLGVLGDMVLNRLATQAITLGWTEPLSGRWIGEPSPAGPRVLLVSSGSNSVAEIVDTNRDERADLVVVAVRPR
jgi:hypothetical protein